MATDDRELLTDFLSEVDRRGAFQLVFPCRDSNHYSQYFEKVRVADKELWDLISKMRSKLNRVNMESISVVPDV